MHSLIREAIYAMHTTPTSLSVHTEDSIDAIDVAAPCPAAWDGMAGSDRVRHCQDCQLNVYNLSEMTKGEATQLIQATEGKVCVRFFRRQDGTVVTKDCPVGLAALKRRARLAYARVAAVVGLLCTAMLGCTKRDQTPRDPATRSAEDHTMLQGKPTQHPIMGEAVAPQDVKMGKICTVDDVKSPDAPDSENKK